MAPCCVAWRMSPLRHRSSLLRFATVEEPTCERPTLTNQGRRRSKAANLPYAKPPFSAPLQGSGIAPSGMGPMAEAGK